MMRGGAGRWAAAPRCATVLPMHLTRHEEEMLAGRHGPAKKLAMEGLVQLGRAYGAPRMVEIGYAHIHAGNHRCEELAVEEPTLGGGELVEHVFKPA